MTTTLTRHAATLAAAGVTTALAAGLLLGPGSTPAQAAPGDCRLTKTLSTGTASCDAGTPGYIQVIISCTGNSLNTLGPKVIASGGTSRKSCPSGTNVDYVSYNYYA